MANENGVPAGTMQTIEDIVFDYLHQADHNLNKASFSASSPVSHGTNNTIILAITAANADIATSGAIRVAQQYDPIGSNTIHVFTKLDILDRGVRADDLLAGRPFKSHPIGVVGVVNRAQEDLDDSVDLKRARDNEEKFLKEQYPKVAHKHGIQYLENMLTSVLRERLKQELPQIRNQLKEIQKEYVKELERFPARSRDALMRFKNNAIFTLYKAIQSKLLGDSRIKDTADDHCELANMFGSKILDYLHKEFQEELNEPNPSDELLTDDEIKETIRIARGIRDPMFLSNEAFERLTKKAIALLKDPCVKCEDDVFGILSQGILTELEHLELDNFLVLKQGFEETLKHVLEKRHEKAKEQIELELTIEETNIFPNDPDIRKLASEILRQPEPHLQPALEPEGMSLPTILFCNLLYELQ